MKAAIYHAFRQPLQLDDLPEPEPPSDGALVHVEACGICRSDWHGWMGHDPDICPPHVPGHEWAGRIIAVGDSVSRWRPGDRVTAPFVCGCGSCPVCAKGDQQVCPHQTQPGFTHWGAFAEYTAVHAADTNLVRLPEAISSVTAASLGCRFATSFRAIVAQGRLRAGEWVAVHGCGGVGLSAVMIARALGGRIVAVDIREAPLSLAQSLGAEVVVNANDVDHVDRTVCELTGGGAHLSIDALGSPVTSMNSVNCLRRRGRHVQIGLLLADESVSALPMARVIAYELEILGSHGMQAHAYEELLAMIESGHLQPDRLIDRTVNLREGAQFLTRMDEFKHTGVTVIDTF